MCKATDSNVKEIIKKNKEQDRKIASLKRENEKQLENKDLEIQNLKKELQAIKDLLNKNGIK